MILVSKNRLAMKVPMMMSNWQDQLLLPLLDQQIDADIDDERRRPALHTAEDHLDIGILNKIIIAVRNNGQGNQTG